MEAETVSADSKAKSAEKKYKCQHCVKSYVTPSKLEIHVRHNHMMLYSCDLCKVKFNTAPELRKHNSSLHWKNFACDFPKCSYTHPKKYMVARHVRQSHDIQRNIICDIEGCNIHFAKCKRKQHFRDCHPDLPITANFMVSQSTPNSSQSAIAMGDDNGNGDVSARTSQGTVEEIHDESDNQSAEAPCKNLPCNASKALEGTAAASSSSTATDIPQYGNRSVFDSSERNTSDEVQCTTCGKMYASRQAVSRHILSVHKKRYAVPKREKNYACAVAGCVRLFRTAAQRDDHENRHKGGKPLYSCHWCNINYHARRQLAYHLQCAHNCSIKNFKSPNGGGGDMVDSDQQSEEECTDIPTPVENES
ncbi:hypothetical protein QR680_001571 [Steinernema hermaphroditum]|uniref:C2H2-type domain-containing protein n=1 Tax=Steinernema hermaphroditum TaxID=289476 RepID=A0AA39GZR2_9BILA|nr:hypothetical protein QR680_001571 [Steinernema hermaphroditum]